MSSLSGSRYYISPLPLDDILQINIIKFCAHLVHIKTYFKAEFDVETAVCGTTVLGAKAVTADVAHTAASARVNFMIVVEYIAKENYEMMDGYQSYTYEGRFLDRELTKYQTPFLLQKV